MPSARTRATIRSSDPSEYQTAVRFFGSRTSAYIESNASAPSTVEPCSPARAVASLSDRGPCSSMLCLSAPSVGTVRRRLRGVRDRPRYGLHELPAPQSSQQHIGPRSLDRREHLLQRPQLVHEDPDLLHLHFHLGTLVFDDPKPRGPISVHSLEYAAERGDFRAYAVPLSRDFAQSLPLVLDDSEPGCPVVLHALQLAA